MGLLTTVIKKPETTQRQVINTMAPGDDKKILLNINSRIEELKSQNYENAKFLRGISRKIETELEGMKQAQENQSVEVYDDSALVESIHRVEQSLSEINNSEILDAIDKVNLTLNNDDILVELRKVNEAIAHIDFSEVIKELDQIKATIVDANPEVVLLEIDKINKTLKEMGSTSVLEEVNKANAKLSEIDMDAVLGEIHRVEALVHEISDKAILSELARIRELVNEKNSDEILGNIDEKIKDLKTYDYGEKLDWLEQCIKDNNKQIEELGTKVDRVNTMPNMLRSVIEHNNDINMKKIEDLLEEIHHRERKRTDGMRLMVNINLWVSILTAAVLIANILGII